MSFMKNNIKIKIRERTLKNEEGKIRPTIAWIFLLKKLSKVAPKVAVRLLYLWDDDGQFHVMVMGAERPPLVCPFVIIATALLVNRILADLSSHGPY